jgi:hypothetical protein
MPIKELIAFGLLSVATIAATGGPGNLRENLLKAQIRMLREVGRTSNWGDPLIWHSRRPSTGHSHAELARKPRSSLRKELGPKVGEIRWKGDG